MNYIFCTFQTEMEMLQDVALERYSNRGTSILSGLRRAGDEMFNVSPSEESIIGIYCEFQGNEHENRKEFIYRLL